MSGGIIHHVTLGADARGLRLDRALALALPVHSRERLKGLVSAGHVRFNDAALRDPATKMRGGESLTIAIPPATTPDALPQAIDLTIVFEDEHLLVVDKPAGLVVHPAAGNLDGTLVNALLHHCAGRLSGIGGVARPGIVHRIDKDTSGLLVVAKTDPAHVGLSAQFARHSVQRRYWAVANGIPAPPAGRVETQLVRSSANRQKIAVVAAPAGKRAVTHWRMTQPLRNAALIECRLETGRTHQVRVHMAHIGHPLLGDPAYGKRGAHAALLAELGFARQALHAATLGFEHPATRERMAFESPMPTDIQALVSRLAS